MIFISSHISKGRLISEQVKSLANEGFRNIELTGGTDFYQGYIQDLKDLKKEYNLNYRLHNYFPPPKKHFVFNLASLDGQVTQDSIEHAKRSIELSRELDSYILGFHAGFFIHISSDELGTDISERELYDEKESTDAFVFNLKIIQDFAGKDFNIYIENNVVSGRNRKQFPDRKPSMLTCYEDLIELKKKIDFNFLLDVAHLKVSSKTYGLDFSNQIDKLITETNYIHVSDNDSLEDQNQPFLMSSSLAESIVGRDYFDYDFTLEIYDNLDNIKLSYNNLQETIG